jgi:serine/threonine-protein kinase
MTSSLERLATALADRYRIERELGAGGMATVYLADDLRHERKVAVKVLRPELAAVIGAERFLHEIKTTAALSHPHILPLLDSGEADGSLYYVMPYVEGESLRERLDREGELPIHDAVRVLVEVADALVAAHAKGVVHRDIKPDNVMLSGRHALVTDFGIAKAVDEAAGHQTLTTTGLAVGTPRYMAPEQCAADPNVDHRADIYALGVMGYELLTGNPPFTGRAPQAVVAAHLTEAPVPVAEVRPTVPPDLAALIMRCLAKRPADRLQRTEELLRQLETLSSLLGSGATRSTPWGSGRRRWQVQSLAGTAVVLAALGGMAWRLWRPRPIAIEIANVRQVTHEPTPSLHAAISPDGQVVAYESGYPGRTSIEVRDVAGGRPVALTADWPNQRGQIQPEWTPDGRNVVFVNPRGTDQHGAGHWKVPRLGGPAMRPDSADLAALRGGVVLTIRGDTISARRQDGAETIVRIGIGQVHSFAWRHDGSAVAYVVGDEASNMTWGNTGPSQVWATRMGGTPVLVTDTSSSNRSPAWLPDGTLLFVSNRDGARDIYAVRFDRAGRPRGEPARLTTGLDAYSVSVSGDGTTAAYDRFILRRNIYAIPIPRSGSVSISEARPLTTGNQRVERIALSADRQWIAFSTNLLGNQDIYVMPAAGGEPRRITRDPGNDLAPGFSADGREIVFSSTRSGRSEIFLIGTDGSGERQLTSEPYGAFQPVLSPDGLRIAYNHLGPEGPSIRILQRAGPDAPWLVSTPTALTGGWDPQWSPDGSSLVYEDGGPPLLLNQGPGALHVYPLGGPPRTLFAGGTEGVWVPKAPNWSADGHLVYTRAFESDGTESIYQMSVHGGEVRRLIRFDDPARSVFEGSVQVGNGMIHVVIVEVESDIYVMDLLWQ